MKRFVVLISILLVNLVAKAEIISLYYDDQLLIEAKQAIQAKDSKIMPYYNSFKDETDRRFLTMKPLSIVDDKIHLAPSGDAKDYISLSPYWWPNPNTESGVPYIRQDGKTNPEVNEYHERTRGELFGKAVQSLAVMYYLSDDEKYAAKASELIRTWFLDKEKGMNPNMTYAQYVPGMTRVRGTGIMDARRFTTGFNAAQMIAKSKSWTKKDKLALQKWAREFVEWLEKSEQGIDEKNARNNHGLWYELTHQILVLYSGDTDYLKQIITQDLLPRIDKQVAKDGSMPEELRRTLSLHYSTFALEALNFSANIASKIGVNLWEYQSANNRSLKLVIDYLLPYYQNPNSWPHKQIKPFVQSRGAIMLYHAGKALNDPAYNQAAQEIGLRGGRQSDINNILYYKLNVNQKF